MQHRSKSAAHTRHHGKQTKQPITHAAPLAVRVQEPFEPAFSLFSAEAKRFPLILTLTPSSTRGNFFPLKSESFHIRVVVERLVPEIVRNDPLLTPGRKLAAF